MEEMRTHFVLYRQCGTKFNNVLVAKGNAVVVSFRSDDFGSGRGFKLTWSVSKYATRTTEIMKSIVDATTNSTDPSLNHSTRNTAYSMLDLFTNHLVSRATNATSAVKKKESLTLVRITHFYRTVPQILNIPSHKAKLSYTYNTVTPVTSLSTRFQKRHYSVSSVQKSYPSTTDQNKHESVTKNTMEYKPISSSHGRVAMSSFGKPKLTEKAAFASIQQTVETTTSEKKSQRDTFRKTTDKLYFWSKAEVKSTTSEKQSTNYSMPSDVVTANTTTVMKNSNFDDNYTVHQTTILSNEVNTNKTDDITSRVSSEATNLKTTLPNTWVNDVSDSSDFPWIFVCVLGIFVLLMCVLVIIIFLQQKKIKRLKHRSNVNRLNDDDSYKTIACVDEKRSKNRTYSKLLTSKMHKSKRQTNVDDEMYLSIGEGLTNKKTNKSDSFNNTSNRRDFAPLDLTELKDIPTYIEIVPDRISICNKTTTFASEKVVSEPFYTEKEEHSIHLSIEGSTPLSNAYLEINDKL
eukprot:XP_011414415.1 PREDICTED: uncharacterized protein LOC105318827 [Crassostrea gigas]